MRAVSYNRGAMARLVLARASPTRRRLFRLYDTLARRYGPQHWWPARTPFEVIVGAILAQNAAWRNAELAVTRLREAGALTPKPCGGCPPGAWPASSGRPGPSG